MGEDAGATERQSSDGPTSGADQMASCLADAQATIAELQAVVKKAAVQAEEREAADDKLGAAKREEESFFERAFKHAERVADAAVAEAKEEAAAILAEGHARAQAIEVRAAELSASVVTQVRQAIEEAFLQEREELTKINVAAHARLLEELDRAARETGTRPKHEPPQFRGSEEPPDNPLGTAAVEANGPSGERRSSDDGAHLPPWTDATTEVPERELHEGRLAAADEADDEFWAELRQAMNDGEPLGPRDDLGAGVDAPVSECSGDEADDPEGHHERQDRWDGPPPEEPRRVDGAPPKESLEESRAPWSR